MSKLLLSTPFSPITRIPAEENISLSRWQSVACVKKKKEKKEMESCLYYSVTGALHMGTETDAARKWRNERTFEILILKFSPNYRVIRNDCRGFNNLSYTIPLR